jgi:hypothetical protein
MNKKIRKKNKKVAWRSFAQAGVSGCQSFASSWCFVLFFLPSVALVSQQNF